MTQFEIIMRTDTPELPAEIGNFEEVKAAISAALTEYKTDAIITADTVKDAEKVRANLRKAKEQIEAYRKDAKSAYMDKFAVFEAQCKELSGLIVAPITAIDTAIKEYELAESEKKWNELLEYFASLNPPAWLSLPDIINPKWRNKTATIQKLKEEIDVALRDMQDDYASLRGLYGESPLWTAINQKFCESKSKSQALVYAAQIEREYSEEQKRAEELQKQREEAERHQSAQNSISEGIEPQAATLPDEPQNAAERTETPSNAMISGAFKVSGTREQIQALATFLKQTGIRFEIIR